MIKTVLSTKKLALNQKELLLNSGIGLVEKDFISIVPQKFELKKISENLIFTSKNAVRIILEHPGFKEFQEKKVFCVGSKTVELLKQNNFSVVETADYGSELADILIKNYKAEEFLFLCGRKRNPDLPEQLKEAQVNFTEVEVYDTLPSPKKYDRIFDGILFFSPSGVQSYCSVNEINNSSVFCIGRTTALEAEKYSDNIIVANKPSVENVLVQVIRYFKN